MDVDELKKAKKAEKKAERKRARAEAAASEAEAAQPEPVPVAVDENAERKKKKKKEKKEEAEAVEVAAAPEPAKPSKEKLGKAPAVASSSSAASSSSGKWAWAPHHAVTARSADAQAKLMAEHCISLEGEGTMERPVASFEEANFPQYINDSISRLGFAKPTPVQMASWPVVMSGRDCVTLAETGSGKTLSFLIPGILHIKEKMPAPSPKQMHLPQVLILTPTRELAIQIHEVYTSLNLSTVPASVIYGGVPKFEQQKEIRTNGCQIMVSTPGRLIDLLEDKTITLERVSYLVLDEADRMLDMGFDPQIRQIRSYLVNPSRQTLMFSATWPSEVQKLAFEFAQRQTVKVTIGKESLSGNANIKQTVEIVNDDKLKRRKLNDLLHKWDDKKSKILVFALYKKSCQWLADSMQRDGFNVLPLHGDMSQQMRNKSMQDYIAGRANILVATDVAARGLDIKDIRYVINYEFPLVVDDYVHRIGRTGRAGAKGEAYTFLTQNEKGFAWDLCDILRSTNQPISAELEHMAKTSTRTVRKSSSMKMYGVNASFDASNPPKAPTKITFDD